MTPELGAILSGQSESVTTPYGNSCMYFRKQPTCLGDIAVANLCYYSYSYVVRGETLYPRHSLLELELRHAYISIRLAMSDTRRWKPACSSGLATSSTPRVSILLSNTRSARLPSEGSDGQSSQIQRRTEETCQGWHCTTPCTSITA